MISPCKIPTQEITFLILFQRQLHAVRFAKLVVGLSQVERKGWAGIGAPGGSDGGGQRVELWRVHAPVRVSRDVAEVSRREGTRRTRKRLPVSVCNGIKPHQNQRYRAFVETSPYQATLLSMSFKDAGSLLSWQLLVVGLRNVLEGQSHLSDVDSGMWKKTKISPLIS